jgi:adenylate cyclase
MSDKIRNFINWFIPPSHVEDPEVFRQSRVLIWTLFITYLFTLNYAVTSFFIDYKIGMWIEFVASFWYLYLPFLFKSTGNFRLTAHLAMGCATICIAICCWYSGGFNSAVYPWLAFPPVVYMLVADKLGGWFWLFVCLIITVVIGVLYINGLDFPELYNLEYRRVFRLICIAGIVAIMFLIAIVFENAKNIALTRLEQKNHQLDREKKRSDSLLLNILPEEITEELKTLGKTNARDYEQATVLFADIKEFTTHAEQMPPQSLVNTLHVYFGKLDNILETKGIEKIKTLGDAYIAVGGVPTPDADSAVKTVQAALEFQIEVSRLNQDRKTSGLNTFEFRIGVHSGPVVAGVVGIKKFAYDIWGDTVNMAARLQQHGEPGEVNVSGTTYGLIHHKIPCKYRGKLAIKHKGDVDMYFAQLEMSV